MIKYYDSDTVQYMKYAQYIFIIILLFLTSLNSFPIPKLNASDLSGNIEELIDKEITNHIQSPSRDLLPPIVISDNATDITNNSAKLMGYLKDNGGDNCFTWFQWEEVVAEECAGIIATGSVCKDGKSIMLKVRHVAVDNQRPWFHKGTNYTYFGVGETNNICRMGQNEKGLAIANFDVGGLIENWEYTSDGASGSEDNDLQVPLGNYSTVEEAAFWIAKHGFHPGQNLIISSEPGVGAIVAVDSNMHSNITWINNTYAGIANAFYCDGDHDFDGDDVRAQNILDDIVENGTSSEFNKKINWKDVAQRVAKDTSGKEFGTGKFGYTEEISRGSSRAAQVAVGGAGSSGVNSTLFMSWLNFAPSIKVGIFLPIYAGALKSANDIPANFSQDNNGDGIFPHATAKHNYASENCAPDQYICARVREILKYANYNENISFDGFSELHNDIVNSSSSYQARTQLADFVNKTLTTSLIGYIMNFSKVVNKTKKYIMSYPGTFHELISDLKPGTLYRYNAWVNNSKYIRKGNERIFLTKPNPPSNLLVTTINQTQIHLSWTKGDGAQFTVIERTQKHILEIGEILLVYNGTGEVYQDKGLRSGTQYSYQIWSFVKIGDNFQISSDFINVENRTAFGNRPPVIISEHYTNATENENYSVLYEHFDPDGDQAHWNLHTNASWLFLNGNNLSGTPGDHDIGPYFVNITCDDKNGSTVYSNFTISIIPVPDAPIIIKTIPPIEFEEDSFYILNLTNYGYDADGDELIWKYYNYSPTKICDVNIVSPGVFIFTGFPNMNGNNLIEFWLEENTSYKLRTDQFSTINITPVNDRPGKPKIEYIINDADQKNEGKQNLTVQFNATPPFDVDFEHTFNYFWDFNDDGISDKEGLNLVKVNYTYPAQGNYSINLTVTDSGGLSNWIIINLTIEEPKYVPGNGEDEKDEDTKVIENLILIIGIVIIILLIISIIWLIRIRKSLAEVKIDQSELILEKNNDDEEPGSD